MRGDGSVAQSAFENRRLFAGREFDGETGLYHYRTRNMDPSLARFVSRDSIGLWGDPANLGNPFAYVGMRPGVYGDPMGLMPPDHIMEQRAAAVSGLLRAAVPYVASRAGNIAAGAAAGAATGGGTGALVGSIIPGAGTAAGGIAGATGGAISGAISGLLADESDSAWDTAKEGALGGVVDGVTAGVGSKFVKGAQLADEAADALRAAKGACPKPSLSKADLLARNKAQGDSLRDAYADLITKDGLGVEKEVWKNTPFGPRRVDIEVSKDGRVLGGVETKAGEATRDTSQIAKDRYLREVRGYPTTVGRDIVGPPSP